MADPGNSTVFLTMCRGDLELSVGSGVLYERGGRHFLVTAWHNLSGRNSDTYAPLSKHLAIPDKVVVTLALMLGDTGDSCRMSIVLPLWGADEANFLVHPAPWPRKDVAVLPIDPEGVYECVSWYSDGRKRNYSAQLRTSCTDVRGVGTDIQPIQACLGAFARLPPEAHLSAGDDLFVLGYPRGIADIMVAPIWKRASIASDPRMGWNRQPCFLIDCASRAGMSGAPVILHSPRGVVRQGGTTIFGNGPSSALCGIYVGRLNDPGPRSRDERDDGLDMAWPSERGDDAQHLRIPFVRINVVNQAMKELEANIAIDEVYQAYDDKVRAITGRVDSEAGSA